MPSLEVVRTRGDVKARMDMIVEELKTWEIYTHKGDALVLTPNAQKAQQILRGKLRELMWAMGEEPV